MLNPWEWLKFLYEWIGHKNPTLSMVFIMMIFMIVGWLVWWRLDVQYRKDHPVNAPIVSTVALTPQPAPPAPSPPAVHPEPSEPKEKKMKEEDAAKLPGRIKTQGGNYAPGGVIQDNRGSTGNNVLNMRAPELVLSEEQQRTAKNILRDSPGAVRLVLPSPVANMADGRTTALGGQMLEIFAGWSIQPLVGTFPTPPGITVVGEIESTKRVTDAFDAAHIPYKVVQHGYAGPSSVGPAPLTITISRSAE
jgi:hypothetical protein